MYHVKIISVGKTKESWLNEALKEYEKRLSSHLKFSWVFTKDDASLESLLAKEPIFIALTLGAKEPTSEEFAKDLYFWLEKFGCKLTFVIGGAEGLSKEIENKAFTTLSLSKMTFTHQMARLLLVEQIYRSHEITRGSNYHK